MMKNIIVFLFVLLSIQITKAQYYYDRSKNPEKNVVQKSAVRDFDKYYFVNWDINKPLSNSDFITDQSSLGTRVGFRKRLNEEDRLWIGGDFSWVVYKQYFPYATYPTNTGGSLSTDLYNYSYNYAITVDIDYLFLATDKIAVPYAGLGLGLAYDKFAQYYNAYGGASDSWGLMVRPEVGVLVGFGQNSSWRLKVAGHYDYATNKNTDFNINGFSNVGFQFGIVKMAW